MKRIFIAFGHHNTTNSFNAAIRDNFIEEVKKNGHEVDLINLFEEKEQLPFYNQNINPPPPQQHRTVSGTKSISFN